LLKSYIFWKYERGSLHYDIMVTLILLFIFITPRLFDYHDRPAAGNLSPSTVLVRPTKDGGLIYEVPYDQVHRAASLTQALAAAIAPISGAVTIDSYDALKDQGGKVTAYKVWAHR
jgi:hypothetical protein